MWAQRRHRKFCWIWLPLAGPLGPWLQPGAFSAGRRVIVQGPRGWMWSPLRAADSLFTLFLLAKTLAQCWDHAARQSWLDPGFRFQRGLKKRYDKMYLTEQVVLCVTAGVTFSHVFSLRLVC